MKKILLLTMLAVFLVTAAAAGPYDDLVRAELAAEVESIQPGQPFWVGIHMEMKPGWHVNWRNPGDAGLAPAVQWLLPAGFSAGEIVWPHPERFELPGLAIFGYEKEVTLLVRIAPPPFVKTGGKVVISAKLDWLACEEACVPGTAEIALTLPVTSIPPETDEEWAARFATARRNVPIETHDWRFAALRNGDEVWLSATPVAENANRAVASALFFPYDAGVFENAAEQTVKREGDRLELRVTRARMSQDEPNRLRGVLVSAQAWGNGAGNAIRVDVAIDE